MQVRIESAGYGLVDFAIQDCANTDRQFTKEIICPGTSCAAGVTTRSRLRFREFFVRGPQGFRPYAMARMFDSAECQACLCGRLTVDRHPKGTGQEGTCPHSRIPEAWNLPYGGQVLPRDCLLLGGASWGPLPQVEKFRACEDHGVEARGECERWGRSVPGYEVHDRSHDQYGEDPGNGRLACDHQLESPGDT
jgi:hypothetical protein